MSRRAALLLVAVVALVALAMVYRLWTGAPSTPSETSKRETTQPEENPVVEYAQLKGLEDEVVRRLQPLGSDGRINDLERRLVEELLSLPPQKRLSPEVLSDLENVARDGEVTESELALLEDRYVSPEPPRISDLRYEATDVRNEKVYEVTVTFSAEDSKTRVAKARLQWIPVRYEHLPREAFPEEKELVYELEPVDGSFDSPREEFRVRVSGFAGGREYVVRVEVWDEAGNKATAELRTEYFREFENVARLDDVLVGAHYYPWYGSGGRHWEEGYKGRPLLGEYDSQDPVVICRHIDWATGHGIDFFLVSWWGPGTYEDVVFREHLLKSQLAGSIKFAVLYETLGRLKAESGPSGLAVNLSDPWNLERLRSDMRYLQQNYFNHPSYLKIDGRPLVEVYLARCMVGDVEEAMSALREEFGVYLLGDLVYWRIDWPEDFLRKVKAFDGATAYNMHVNVLLVLADFEELLDLMYGEWSKVLSQLGVSFVPSAIPGFDDRAVRTGNMPLPRSVDRFHEQLLTALSYMSRPRMVLVTSFNEWHEYTSVEPSKEFGTSYLETLRDALRAYLSFEKVGRGLRPPRPSEVVGGRMVGFALTYWGEVDMASYEETPRRVGETHANTVAVLAFCRQKTRSSSEVYVTQRDLEIARMLAREAKNAGFNVILYVFLLVDDCTWRGAITPRDPAGWFEAYREAVAKYAEIAEAVKADVLCVGTELTTMENYEEEWLRVIETARGKFSGNLTYALNWWTREDFYLRVLKLTWLKELDYVGVDAYFPITSKERPNAEEAVKRWYLNPEGRDLAAELEILHETTGRPILFTEIGYRSIADALSAPWDWQREGEYDEATQAVGLHACFEVFKDKPWVSGIIVWAWDIRYEPRYGDTGYNVYSKLAHGVVAEWFRLLGRK